MNKSSTKKRLLPLLMVLTCMIVGYVTGALEQYNTSSSQAIEFIESTMGAEVSFSNAIKQIIEMVSYSVLS